MVVQARSGYFEWCTSSSKGSAANVATDNVRALLGNASRLQWDCESAKAGGGRLREGLKKPGLVSAGCDGTSFFSVFCSEDLKFTPCRVGASFCVLSVFRCTTHTRSFQTLPPLFFRPYEKVVLFCTKIGESER